MSGRAIQLPSWADLVDQLSEDASITEVLAGYLQTAPSWARLHCTTVVERYAYSSFTEHRLTEAEIIAAFEECPCTSMRMYTEDGEEPAFVSEATVFMVSSEQYGRIVLERRHTKLRDA